MNNTTLVYSGRVEVKTKTRTEVSHNHGSKHLFRLLTVLLAKEKFQTTSFPAKIMLFNATPEELLTTPQADSHQSRWLLKRPVDIVSSAEIVNNGQEYQSKFTAMIDSAVMVEAASVSNLALGLLDGSQSKLILAATEFDPSQYNIVRGGGQAYLTWIMTIGNGELTQTTEAE